MGGKQVFLDRLQIGRVIELVSDLQGEGQAPAGKCIVSYLHILNGRHNNSNGELTLKPVKNKLLYESLFHHSIQFYYRSQCKSLRTM